MCCCNAILEMLRCPMRAQPCTGIQGCTARENVVPDLLRSLCTVGSIDMEPALSKRSEIAEDRTVCIATVDDRCICE